ncbi:Dynein heavy chain 3, axonemal [Homalodisca vitripennis]|nr:Dynein heavy chain 3, axonemal [Homalodisca vitripennis]
MEVTEELLSVKPDEEEVQLIIAEALEAFDTNTPGPQKFLDIYNKYLYILSGEAGRALDKFFSMDPFPYLKVISMMHCVQFIGIFLANIGFSKENMKASMQVFNSAYAEVFINDFQSAAGRGEHPLSNFDHLFVSSASPTEP